MIRVPTVRVVDEEGAQLGVLPTLEALRLAQERGYDLVEVAPMAVPPVVRLLDYGQYKYEAAKKEKEARRHQRSVDFKEIRLKPKIGQGDFDTKVRRAIQFLEDGDRVKVACQFRGRELTHANLGRDLLSRFAELMKDYGTVERQPLLEGKSMSIVIASNYKPKPQPGTEGRAGEDAEPATRGAATAPVEATAPVAASAPGPGGPAPVATAQDAPAVGAPPVPPASTGADVPPGSAPRPAGTHTATGRSAAPRASARRPAGSTAPGSAGE
jgi:translation initiation factor IF-3